MTVEFMSRSRNGNETSGAMQIETARVRADEVDGSVECVLLVEGTQLV